MGNSASLRGTVVRGTQSKSNKNAVELHVSGWAVAFIAVGFFVVSQAIHHLVESALICSLFGDDAWQTGLRVIDNKANLSSGGQLSEFHRSVLNGGSFLVSAVVVFGSAAGYLNFRERLTEKSRVKTQ